ncbi:MAG: hypothetical protein KGL02_11290, partial [Acidobacteriota bacterium]|nr:hypothetical protein [Acidobacteriota bacterium]
MATVHHSPLNPGANPPVEISLVNTAPDKPPVPSSRTLNNSASDALRARALEAARRWTLLDPADSHERFARELA